ncbi:cation-translocating P-type ATPase [Chitinophaga oryziterrae]|nr:cation-translocating P-type ATPase [Chitinophaga oryziterrae]
MDKPKMYWAQNDKLLAEILNVDPALGLTLNEAAARLDKEGPNSIMLQKDKPVWLVLISQFASPLIWLLLFSTVLSFFFGEYLDGIAIGIVIIINASIGFAMEMQAQHSMRALMKMTTITSKVLREGQITEIASEEIVRGDVLFVEGGDMVTADARLIKAAQVQADESVLTGESLPVEKEPRILSADTQMADRTNMLYKGTFITRGNGIALVVNTGMSSELGTVAGMVKVAQHAATPLEKKISDLSKKLIRGTLVLVVMVFIAGILYNRGIILMLKTAIALAVAAIPEGLPVVCTLALAYGMLLMARKGVIVKKMSSVETLGGVNVICTDKTGTLTQNRIEVSHIQVNGKRSDITVNIPAASLLWQQDDSIAGTIAFQQVCRIAALCNTASFRLDNEIQTESGDPLETALLKMVHCTSLKPADYQRMFPLVTTIPFSSDTRIMATLHSNNNRYYLAVKGSIEDVLNYCTAECKDNNINPLTDKQKEHWLSLAEKQATSGLRVLGFAFRSMSDRQTELLNDLTFAGYIGFMDPPRQEVSQSIRLCREAGIRVIMITGDHPATAKNIALQLGITTTPGAAAMTGKQMRPYQQLTSAEKKKWLNTSVFARVTPEQKLDLIKVYQEQKMIVGMVGDGVNDAPAIKKADIGIAMGQRGTQVAQEVADMVLKNESFSFIVLAIRQGRIIFDNIRKFVVYLLSSNLSELLVIATIAILNLPFQLLPLQILFINLVTDLLPALALGITPGAPDIMQRKPYLKATDIIDRKRWIAIITYAFIIAVNAVIAVAVGHRFLPPEKNRDNNILFYTLILAQVLHVFNMSFNRNIPLYKTEVFRNRYVWYAVISCVVIVWLSWWIKPVRMALGVVIHDWQDWFIILSCSLLSLIFIRLCKKLKWVI